MEKIGYKEVTSSHLPALLGNFGKSKYDDYWKIVSEDLTEKEIRLTEFLSFQRGHHSKSEALAYFKACVCYFLSNFNFPPNDSPSKTMKNVFYFI